MSMDAAQPSAGEPARTARAEAAVWMVRLHSPDRSADVEAGFRAWLAAHPENGRQFERVTEVWDAGAVPVPGIARMKQWPRVSSTNAWLVAAALAVVAVGLGVWSANRFWLNPAYSTGNAEQRIVRLKDGSRISLNSNTRVSVTYGAAARRVRIERGEAYFEVARDPARAFTVNAGDHRITALGTSFVVRYEARGTAVTLVDGKVAVSAEGSKSDSGDTGSLAARKPEVFLLAPGERVTFEGGRAQLDIPRIDTVTAWRRNEVVLEKTALADAVREMNRYDEVTLVIDDPAIADLRISGIYHTGDSEGFARTMGRLYGLQVTHHKDRIHLRLAEK